MSKKKRDRMKQAIEKDMLGVLVGNFKAIDREVIIKRFPSDVHGYEKHTYYQDFVHIETCDLSRQFQFINDAEVNDYGFHHPEWDSLLTENNNTRMKVEVGNIRHYDREIDFKLIIQGEPKDIDLLSEQGDLEISTTVTGTAHHNKSFWQESLYSMYHLYRIGNFIGAFMNGFIAFEGYLRSVSADYDTKIAKLYKQMTGRKFVQELKEYRDLRNDLMHGNENDAWMIDEEDIINLLSYFLEAYDILENKTKS